jgi:hypothetical protein
LPKEFNMLPALYDDQRTSLGRLAAMLVILGAAILPMTAQSSAVASAQEQGSFASLALPAIPGSLTFPDVAVNRDPFRPEGALGEMLPSESATGMETGQGSEIGIVLPPNAGAAGGTPTQVATGGPVVRAIITGGHNRALIDLSGVVQVFAVGDRVGDQPIVAIDGDGVRLGDGTRLPMADEK